MGKYFIYKYPYNDENNLDKFELMSYDNLSPALDKYDQLILNGKAVQLWEKNGVSDNYILVRKHQPQYKKTFHDEYLERTKKEILYVLGEMSKHYEDVMLKAPISGEHSLKHLVDYVIERVNSQYFLDNMKYQNFDFNYGKGKVTKKGNKWERHSRETQKYGVTKYGVGWTRSKNPTQKYWKRI